MGERAREELGRELLGSELAKLCFHDGLLLVPTIKLGHHELKLFGVFPNSFTLSLDANTQVMQLLFQMSNLLFDAKKSFWPRGAAAFSQPAQANRQRAQPRPRSVLSTFCVSILPAPDTRGRTTQGAPELGEGNQLPVPAFAWVPPREIVGESCQGPESRAGDDPPREAIVL